MTQFVILAKAPNGDDVRLTYDNMTNELLAPNGQPVLPPEAASSTSPAFAVSKDNPASKGKTRVLKIQLGLSCNYSCEYCSQRFVPHVDETNKHDVEPFLAQLVTWLKDAPERIEFWGGEPFVYWKTLKPLAERLRERFPTVEFSVITNGSLIDDEKIEWLDRLGFRVGISHDAGGQHVRGPDPLDEPKTREAILKLYRLFAPKGRISFNAMLNRENTSRAAIQEFFVKLTGDPNVPIGEGSFIDPYDQGGLKNSLDGDAERAEFSNRAFVEFRSGAAKNFGSARSKTLRFIEALHKRTPASSLGQKCGMDRPGNIAVDLKGNVLTCQNVSAVATAPNGQPHKIGHVSDFENIKLTTATHWSKRRDCPKCPVLHLCQGSCMFLEGALWDAGCANSYADNIVFFAAAIEVLTGCIPIYIEGDLPENRKDIFGLIHPPKRKRVIPIKAV